MQIRGELGQPIGHAGVPGLPRLDNHLLGEPQGLLRHRGATEPNALVSQERLRDIPTPVDLTYQAVRADAYVLEEHFTQFSLARHRHDRADGDAWAIQRDEQKTDSLLFFGILTGRPGSDEREDVSAFLRMGRPDL